ncbi:MFS transporter [Parasphaerochaeta coccoides]|uniref:Major facilitator superfamily MFS_1 n=1 Tax=Parasphaerochaeta coccoides (strain ATCC BAA-1237 / DSM 17374 / SPN1) TaxID=760011 RepID=F4GID6_PARC1|nr:MFS transporter [Parasphaerochaeta coccoides]AEC01644.1 major facilitator superfamily MFS_1 [Parasphaerochaeta coccoides DSM 17374]
MKLISQYKGLNKNFYIMTFTVLINCAGSFVSVFLSLYLTIMLGFNTAYTGLIVSIYTLLHIPGSLIGGKLADACGRKVTMVVSQIIMGVCFILAGFILYSEFVLIVLFIANFCDGITDPARSALEVDMTTPQDRQVAFSLLYQAFNIGFAIGPLLAGMLFYSHPQWLFWGNGIALITSILAVTLFVPDYRPKIIPNSPDTINNSGENAVEGSIVKVLLSRPQLLLFSVGVFFVAFSYKQISFVLPIQLNTMFGADGVRIYGIVAAINAFSVIILNPVILNISKKNNILKNILFAILLYAIAFSFLGFANIPWHFFLLTLLYTIGEILLNNNSKAYQNNNTPVNFRGRFNAILPLYKTSGTMIAPIIGGIILSRYSYIVLWILSGSLSLITYFIYLHIYKKYESK